MKAMGCTMGKCKQCGVLVQDDTQVCPLCRCVLEQAGGEDTYPDVYLTVRRLKKISNVCLFCLLLISTALGAVNYWFYQGVLWCLIPIAAMAYGYLVLRFAILSKSGYRIKIMVLVACGLGLVVLIDALTGLRGWSLNVVLPGGLMLVDGGIVALMLINRKSWQSYIVFQIGMILISLIPLLLWRIGLVTWPFLSLLGEGIAIFLFLGTLIIGDKGAREELRRRFHI